MENLNRQFGLVIAYLLPGFVALAGVVPLAPTVAGWLHADPASGLGAPVYALLAATATGMVVSCFRWLLVDKALALTGVKTSAFNAKALEETPAAFTYLVENHYRYYQFYANTLVAAAWAYAVHRKLGTPPLLGAGTDLGVLILCAVLFVGSRDALSKYRDRGRQLSGSVAPEETKGQTMTNGIDHHQGGSSSPKPPAPKASERRQAPAKPKAPDAKHPSPPPEAK